MLLLNKFVWLLAESPPSDVEEIQGFFEEVKTSLSSFDMAVKLIVNVALVLLFSFIGIQLYRYFWRKWWKTHPPRIQDRFIYNIILIFLYIVIVIVVFFQFPGGDKVILAILSGSSFLALGVGLAAQESISNVVNGMMISVSKPFEVGDRIHLINGNITGYVEDITLRHTVIRTFVNSRIIVPNATINKDMIENSNYQQNRASSFIDVVITFDSDIERARAIMADVIGNNPKYLDIREDMSEPKVKVFMRDISINGACLRASMWTSSIDNNFEASSDARYEIMRRFKEEGILFAQLPGRPEAFARAGVPGRA